MKILFEPTGTHVHKDILKARFDLYPDKGEKSYAQNYVYVPVFPEGGYPGKVDAEGNPVNQKAYDKWEASLPHIWQLNPCLSVFVRIDQNITKQLMTEFVQDIWKPDVLATIDNCMVASNSAHLISPYMRHKAALSTAKTLSFDAQAKSYIDSVLADFNIGAVKGKAERIEPGSITVGNNATDGGTASTVTSTTVETDVPADGTGVLDTIQIWANSNLSDFKAGTFWGDTSTGVFSSRDYELIGSVTSGSAQNFTGLSINVYQGDFLGHYGSSGILEASTGGHSFRLAGDQFGASWQTFASSTYKRSIQGTGPDMYSGIAAYQPVTDTASGTTIWRAMTFPGVAGYIPKTVSLLMERVGSPGTLTVSIRETDIDGKPTGADLCTATIDADHIDTTKHIYGLLFGSDIVLTSAQYSLILKTTSTGDADNRVNWRALLPGNYADGDAWNSSDSGSTWNSSTYERYFVILGTEAGGGWANIAKVNGVAAAAIAKINGVAVAAVAKINGVTV
jgi:hypothetical protein